MGQLAATFDSLMERYGFRTNLYRLVNGSPNLRVEVLVRRRYAEEKDLVQDVSQNATWYHIRRKELDEAAFPLPVRKGDRILDDGEYYTVYVSEPLRDGPDVIGYRVRCIGE